MRTLVREILEPVIERNDHEAEKYLQLDKKTNHVQKRLEILEYAILNEQPPPAHQIAKQNSVGSIDDDSETLAPPTKKVPNVFEQIFQKISDIVPFSAPNCYLSRTSIGKRSTLRLRTSVCLQSDMSTSCNSTSTRRARRSQSL